MPLKDVPTIHAVTDHAVLGDPDFPKRAADVLRALGPAGAIHLRGHGVAGRALLAIAEALIPVQQETGGWLVLNDRLDVALAAGARGVQLGRRSLLNTDVRRVAPGLALGVAVHADTEARQATDADWWLVGHIFDTPSHPGVAGRGTRLLGALRPHQVPMIAIGGITPGNAAEAREAGAHGVAAIRGIWLASDPARAANEYLSGMTAVTTACAELTIQVNGETRVVPPGCTVQTLLDSLALDPRLVVVERNRTILRDRDAFATTALAAGDVLELVHFVGGG